MKRVYLFFIILSIISSKIFPCPYELLNDFNVSIMVVNPNALNKIYYIEPNQKIKIDSAIANRILSLVKYESLDFYLPAENGEFKKFYSLIEKYCSKESTLLTLGQIKHMAKYPTDRFEVKVSYIDNTK